MITFVKDCLGSVRGVVDLSGGTVLEQNDYYAYGERVADSTMQTTSLNRWRYNAKEEQDSIASIPYLDYGARLYDPVIGRWLQQDPMAEKYPHLSPYNFCGGNPVWFIDQTGMDIWEINDQGKIVNHIKDNKQDAFYMVDNNGNRTYTTDTDGNKHYNSITFIYGTITDSKKSGWFRSATSFAVNSESSGAELFKFFADNTNIEFGLINTQSNGSIVMTNHNESSVRASATSKSISDEGQTVTSVVHNHPHNSNPSGFRKGDTRGDKFAAKLLTNSHGYQVGHYVYQPGTGNLVAYDEKSIIGSMPWGFIFAPSKARIIPVLPIRYYPGVGLPPP